MAVSEEKIKKLIGEIDGVLTPEFIAKVKKSFTKEQMKYLTTVLLVEVGKKKTGLKPPPGAPAVKLKQSPEGMKKQPVKQKETKQKETKQKEIKPKEEPVKWKPKDVEEGVDKKDTTIFKDKPPNIDVRI